MPVSAVVFDMDGTLTDTEAEWDVVRRGLAEEAGVPWPDGATQAMMGMSTGEWSRYLAEEVGLPMSPEEAAAETVSAMAEHYKRGVRLLPGAVEAVKRMAERHPVAIASSSARVLIDVAVEVMGLTDVLSATVSTEEVPRGKPAPDGYLRACELLGVDPTEAVAVEDATNGILSALNGGLAVIAVPPHFHPPAAELLARVTVIDNLGELSHELVSSLRP